MNGKEIGLVPALKDLMGYKDPTNNHCNDCNYCFDKNADLENISKGYETWCRFWTSKQGELPEVKVNPKGCCKHFLKRRD